MYLRTMIFLSLYHIMTEMSIERFVIFMITETSLINDRQLRERYISKVESLDKVKKLFLIPKMECMTIRQLSDYFDVGYEAIKSQYKRNQDEFDEDGVTFKTPSDFHIFNGSDRTVKDMNQQHGKLVITLSDNIKLVIPNRGIKCFPKRAILRMAMLLQDSEVAKEVRTQLLNIAEKVIEKEPEKAVEDIESEQKYLDDIIEAYRSGNADRVLAATSAYTGYQNRHIEKLKKSNEELNERNNKLSESNSILAGDILEWSNRKSANSVVRLMAKQMHQSYASVWGFIYKELLYKHGINLKQRGNRKPPYISQLRESEWECFYKSAAAIMQMNNIEPSEIFAKIRKERVKVIA